MTRSDIVQLILSVLTPYANAGAALDENTTLVGRNGVLDSIGLVNLIVDLEGEISSRTDKILSLADERALSLSASPFRTVAALADHIDTLLGESAAHG